MASKKTVYNTAEVVNTYLKETGTGRTIEIGHDACGYLVREMSYGKCMCTMHYGLRAKEVQFILDGMVNYARLIA